ncbi:hypothetical protein TVAG_006780 [Trichomonas vaginalis G3]|uniref:Uncharacterized protein n=1 Tax=Trichomonas vaginalis (strain ATCC PRA-98 / G3) TaxID=412133 RepID=A2FC01_TRIV3|nr:hypothetical protein TVAGG3_0964180 [Trichomonas vaginalis G3]EAX97547.1 hypothetical protein TVAG_006780 [Trichomonas vaginalis G3]KAI5488122.1 hypothetical protein TVAGG3_0964180 [Trichomonas vaginalis G3]|eukprot:XP_001310477.1 hypothetical protein [Trichomonas vaginalis G3]
MTQIPQITQLASNAGIQIDELKADPNSQGLAVISDYFQQNFGDSSKLFVQPDQHSVTKEKERIAERLGSFNPKDNAVWHEITQRFGANIKQPELLSIANVLAQNASIKLDRDAKRRKSVLIKWFEENWNAIQPYLAYVVLEDTKAE